MGKGTSTGTLFYAMMLRKVHPDVGLSLLFLDKPMTGLCLAYAKS